MDQIWTKPSRLFCRNELCELGIDDLARIQVIEGPRSAIESALTIATTNWNAVTLEDAGLSPGAIKEVRQQLATLPPPGPQIFWEVVSALIESRRTEFAEANWTVAKCELRGHGEKSRIHLEARALPSRG